MDLEGDEKPVSAQTIIHRLNSFSKLIQEWRLANGLSEQLVPNPVIKGVRPKKGKGRHRRLSEIEARMLADAAAASSRVGLLDATTVAIETGMRQTQLAKLTWDRV